MSKKADTNSYIDPSLSDTGALKEKEIAEEKPKNNLKGNSEESVISPFIMVILSIVYFFFVPKILGWLIPQISNSPWVLLWSVPVFYLSACTVYYLCSEYWSIGNKYYYVIIFIGLIVIIIAFLQIYYSEQENSDVLQGPTSQLQIVPQISYGWKVDNDGNLIASLKPGEEATKSFHLKEYQSTPWIKIPQDNYRFQFTNLQTVIVDDKNKKTIVHPENYYDMGIVTGERKFRFISLKGGAELILHIKRL